MWKFILGAVAALAAVFGVQQSGMLQDEAAETRSQGATSTNDADGWIGDAEALRAHMQFLSDDLLEGREAGSRGYDVAALYAANYFASLGLKPAGDEGSYWQNVPLLKITRDAAGAQMALIRDGRRQQLTYAEDFIVTSSSAHEESDVTAPMVFVGWGVEAPEFGVNSYENIDVEGKIVVLFGGGPPQLPAEERAHFGSGATKAALAASKGAVGMISIYTPAFEQIYSFERLAALSDRSGMTWISPDGEAHAAHPEIRASAVMAPEATQQLFDGADAAYADLRNAAAAGDAMPSFDLLGEATLAQRTRHQQVSSPNVAAMLEGGDPDLKDEYVVYTAHLDHDGYGPEVDGDNLYNGAVDNASGSSVVLDIARAFVEAEKKPRRSVIFLLVTAEEKGLRGAGYFAHHPTAPIENIVANINSDGVMMFFDFADVLAFGDTHSTIKAHLTKIADLMGLGVMADPYPEQGFFTRSDHYRFVQQGVPSVFMLLGFTATDGTNAGEQAFQTYLGQHYHKPSDDLAQPFDYVAGAKFVEFQYRLGESIANADERPEWNEGDFFGDLFGR